MQEIAFSIPLSGLIRIEDGFITIKVNKADTMVRFETPTKKQERINLGQGRNLFDVVLETARAFVKYNENDFTGAQLYAEASKQYPELKRNSWTSHIIACAPNHPSHKHYGARRDYLRYHGNGKYSLDFKYQDLTMLQN
jgi:hypothetical protein